MVYSHGMAPLFDLTTGLSAEKTKQAYQVFGTFLKKEYSSGELSNTRFNINILSTYFKSPNQGFFLMSSWGLFPFDLDYGSKYINFYPIALWQGFLLKVLHKIKYIKLKHGLAFQKMYEGQKVYLTKYFQMVIYVSYSLKNYKYLMYEAYK